MSYDLAVWGSTTRLCSSDREVYLCLADGDTAVVADDERVLEFRRRTFALYPQLVDVAEPGHDEPGAASFLLLTLPGATLRQVDVPRLEELAEGLALTLYDPQQDEEEGADEDEDRARGVITLDVSSGDPGELWFADLVRKHGRRLDGGVRPGE